MTESDAPVGSTEIRKTEQVASKERLLGEAFLQVSSRSELLDVDTRSPAKLFAEGLYDGAVTRPIQALKQLTDDKEASQHADSKKPNGAPESGYSTAGQIVGSLLPFVALAAVTRGATNQIFGKLEEQTLRRAVSEQAVSGFALGAFLTPSELKPGESLLDARLKTGLKDATVFGSMALTSGYLSKAFPGSAQAEINNKIGSLVAHRMGIGAASGAVGGFLDAEIRTGGTASGDELLVSMAGYAAFGGIMEGGNVLARRYFAASRANETLATEQGRNRESMQLAAERVISKDSNTTVIDNFSGWYDKLLKAVRNAQPGQTIIVTEEKWLKEGQLMLRRANKPEVNLILAKPVAENSVLASVASSEAGKMPALPGSNQAKMENGARQALDRSNLAKSESGLDRRAGLSADKAAVAKADTAAPSALMDKVALGKAIESEVLKSGRDPADALVEALKKNRVLMIGEYHRPDDPHREFGAQIIERLQKAGATHLAIEHGSNHKGKIFGPDGEVNRDQFSSLMTQWEYFRLLKNARKAGMEVVPVDSSNGSLAKILEKLKPELKGLQGPDYNAVVERATLGKRNLDMADNIGKILEDPKAKVVFWIGNYHLNTTQLPGEAPQVVNILRDRKIPTATFATQQDGYFKNGWLRSVYTPPRAYAVPMKEAPVLGRQSSQEPGEAGLDRLLLNQYDYVIMYPKKGYTYD